MYNGKPIPIVNNNNNNNNNNNITYGIIIKFIYRLRTVFTYDAPGKLIKRHRQARHTDQSRSVIGELYIDVYSILYYIIIIYYL